MTEGGRWRVAVSQAERPGRALQAWGPRHEGRSTAAGTALGGKQGGRRKRCDASER